MPGDAGDLVRIEGVRGSNPLSSTEFFQVRWPSPATTADSTASASLCEAGPVAGAGTPARSA
jgi:hypothetical protein